MAAEFMPEFTSDESKVSELFQLLHASLQEEIAQPPGVVQRDLSFLLAGDGDTVGCKQIGVDDGFVNYIYRLGGAVPGGQSVVVKWARMIMRVAEAQKIDLKEIREKKPDAFSEEEIKRFLGRNTDECHSLLKVGMVVPGSTPEIYRLDVERHFFLMEDLKDSFTLRQRLIDGEVIAGEFEAIARFFGKLHSSTFISQLSKDEYDDLAKLGPPAVLLDRMTEFMFSKAFQTDSPMSPMNHRKFSEAMTKSGVLEEIFDHPDIKKATAKMAESFRRKICFVHNDSHPGSYMINPKHEVKVIDFEFTTFGNPAKEIGYALGETVLFYHIYIGTAKLDLARKLVEAVRSFLEIYLDMAGDLVLAEIEDFWPLVALHAGHFGGMRTIGMILPFPQFEGLEECEVKCVRVLGKLMKNMEQIKSMDEFLQQAFPAIA